MPQLGSTELVLLIVIPVALVGWFLALYRLGRARASGAGWPLAVALVMGLFTWPPVGWLFAWLAYRAGVQDGRRALEAEPPADSVSAGRVLG